MLEQVVARALEGCRHGIEDLQDAQFRALVTEGQEALVLAREEYPPVNVLPLRYGLAEFGLAMNTLGVAEAREQARQATPRDLGSNWARERAWFIRFGQLLIAEMERLLPQELLAIISKMGEFGATSRPMDESDPLSFLEGAFREAMTSSILDALKRLAFKAETIERESFESPLETVLPWLFMEDGFRYRPTCLGYAILMAVVCRKLKRQARLATVPALAGREAVLLQSEFLESLRPLLREAGVWVSGELGCWIEQIVAQQDRAPEEHVAVVSRVGDESAWMLTDPFTQCFWLDVDGLFQRAHVVLESYLTTGLSFFLSTNETRSRLAPQMPDPEETAASAVAIQQTIQRLSKDPARALAQVGRMYLERSEGIGRSARVDASSWERANRGAGGICVMSLLTTSLSGPRLLDNASASVRAAFHSMREEHDGSSVEVEEFGQFEHLARLVSRDERFLREVLQRMPGLAVVSGVASSHRTWDELKHDLPHAEMEVMDLESGLGQLALGIVADTDDRAEEMEQVLFEHGSGMYRSLYWAADAPEETTCRRERLSLQLLGDLPTEHVDALEYTGRERRAVG